MNVNSRETLVLRFRWPVSEDGGLEAAASYRSPKQILGGRVASADVVRWPRTRSEAAPPFFRHAPRKVLPRRESFTRRLSALLSQASPPFGTLSKRQRIIDRSPGPAAARNAKSEGQRENNGSFESASLTRIETLHHPDRWSRGRPRLRKGRWRVSSLFI